MPPSDAGPGTSSCHINPYSIRVIRGRFFTTDYTDRYFLKGGKMRRAAFSFLRPRAQSACISV